MEEAVVAPKPAKITMTTEEFAQHIAEVSLQGRDVAYANTAPSPPTVAQKALTFHPKTAAGGLSGAASIVVLYVLDSVWGIVPPVEVAAAATVVVTTAFAWLAPRAPTPA